VTARSLPSLWVCLLACVLQLLATTVLAHTRSESFSHWTVDGSDIRGTILVPAREATRFSNESRSASSSQLLIEDIERHVSFATESPCLPSSRPVVLPGDAQFIRVEWRLRCTSRGPLTVRISLLFDEAPSHIHFAQFIYPSGSVNRIFTMGESMQRVEPPSRHADGTGFFRFVGLGLDHILTGYDHLAFLLALVLISPLIRTLVLLVTGFTIGHSLSLALAAMGAVQPDSGMVEALIGFTIAITAIKGLAAPANSNWLALFTALTFGAVAVVSEVDALPRAALGICGLAIFSFCFLRASRDRTVSPYLAMLVTTGFGLVHGMGFASALNELELSGTALLKGLVGFNLGVELGQLAVVVCLFLLLRMLQGRLTASRFIAIEQVSGLLLCGLGSFWFFSRWLAL